VLPQAKYHQLVELAGKNGTAHKPADPVGDVILEGSRNDVLASLAGSMRRRGMGEAEILAALLVTNQRRCRPPLPQQEVERIARSIARRPAAEPTITTNGDAPTVDTDDARDPTCTFTEFVAHKDEMAQDPLISAEQGTLLPAGGLAILAATTGHGKTTLTVELVQHASAGCEYLGLTFPRPLNVLVIENEGPREAFRVQDRGAPGRLGARR
jgi:Primase C terminal 1 (PriCT-1)/AAA domain